MFDYRDECHDNTGALENISREITIKIIEA